MTAKATARLAVVLMAGASLAACATNGPRYAPGKSGAQGRPSPGYKVGQPYQVGGVWYVPREQPNYDEVGIASWYGDAFHLKATANGELFDKDLPSAAHTTLPLPSLVEVTNLANGKKLIVRVNDRGPFVDGRIIDLSHEAARRLGYDRQGLARVRVRYVGRAPLYGEDTRRYARNTAPAPVTVAAAAPSPPAPPQPKDTDLVFTSTPMPKAGAVEIVQSSLAPLPQAAAPPPAPAPTSPAAPAAAGFRVQAGAFSSEANARRAVAQLATTGLATVEPVTRNGATLYRVVLDGLADQDAAEDLRQRIAEIGFADARVIRPF